VGNDSPFPALEKRINGMPKKKSSTRKTSKLHELEFRVFRVPEILKEQLRTAREAEKMSNELFICKSCDLHLEELVRELIALGVQSPSGTMKPARWPFRDETLKRLRKASAATNILASTLLQICLSRLIKAQSGSQIGRKKRRAKTKGSHQRKPKK
jgi:hypothetical protein